ncbi:hypothetical protein BaOVIS_023110 [Babesia ovis]|uniref:Uncharacterized protein n=1 Tax=Babesia ovis TaxID=5869 RepID=A0A9W5TB72_BABOV|nr:hypothetical protein BaOVIS_023110 [Babesia ovis]
MAMVESAVLPMLYEFLVSESRYEVRGSEYRARLRSLFDDMLSSQQAFPQSDTSIWRQISVKVIDEMIASAGFLDHEDVRMFGLRACPGIHQYAYPEIPEFDRLNLSYLKTWYQFFGLLDKSDRVASGNKVRRIRQEELPIDSESGSESEDEDYSTESDSSDDLDHPDVVITTDDILCPRTAPESIDTLLNPDGIPVAGDAGAIEDKTKLRWHRNMPIYMDSSYKIDHGNIVFGVMTDAHLSHEWSCNSSYSAFESTLQRFMSRSKDNCDTLYDSGTDGGSDTAADAVSDDDSQFDEPEPLDQVGTKYGYKDIEDNYDSTVYSDQSDDDERVDKYSAGKFRGVDEESGALLDDRDDPMDCSDEGDTFDDSSSQTTVDSAVDDEYDDFSMYDPNSIYGNYYCELPCDHPRTLERSLGGTTTTKQRASGEYHSYTADSMAVTSTVFVGNDGVPQLSCVGTLGERQPSFTNARLKRYTNGQLTLQNRLEYAISSLFAIKNAVSAECTICSGWSVNNGVSMIFCEFCEDKLLETFDPSVINLLFELRRHLVSDMYPSLGYTFVSQEAKESVKGDRCSSYVTIPALCNIGGIYPKAAMHDGRYVPNTTDIPRKALYELSSIVLTNAELCSYAESGSRILPLCLERRKQRMRAFNTYLEGLCKLYESSVNSPHYSLVVNEFNNVFKHGMMPFMNDGVSPNRRFFDEVTSSLLCKLPLDADLLRSMFYCRGIYADHFEGTRKSNLLSLIEQDSHNTCGSSEARTYEWHAMANKHWNRKCSAGEQSARSTAPKTSTYRLRPGLYQEFVTRSAIFDRLPPDVVNRIHSTGRLDIGFPTSLQMHIAAIPDAVLDPLMFSKCGMSFFYSMPALIQNLCALCMFISVGEKSDGQSKRRARDNGTAVPLLQILSSVGTASAPLSQTTEPRHHPLRARSLLDDPLLLAESQEPGREHELVLSESPAYGLQRTLYTHRRHVKAKGPLYQPGDHVYLVSGPYRNARGTVLSTYRRAPGEPHLVTVVLDCRNERGILMSHLKDYHGSRITVWETQLDSQPLFAPYSPPTLYGDAYRGLDRGTRRRPKASDGLTALVMERIINSIHIDDLQSAFDYICQLGISSAYPYMSLLIQVARRIEISDDIDKVRSLVNAALLRVSDAVSQGYSEDQRHTIPWFTWSLSVLRIKGAIEDWESFENVCRYLMDLVIDGHLRNLSQGEIGLLAMGFRFKSHSCQEVMYRLAMIYSYTPAKTALTKHVAALATSLSDARVLHPGFSRLVCNMIKYEYSVPSPHSAVAMLKYLSKDRNTPQSIKDALFACCSVAHFLRPSSSPYGPCYNLAITLATLSDREMSELLHALRSGETELPINAAMRALFNLPVDTANLELIKLLLAQVSAEYESLRLKHRIRVLTVARRMKDCPAEVIDAVERILTNMEPDRVLEPAMAQALGEFLPHIPDTRSSVQRLILNHLERFVTFSLALLRENAMDPVRSREVMLNATSFLQSIPSLGYELPSFAQQSATLIREGINSAPDKLSVLLSIMSIQAMCPKYFNDAAEAAQKVLTDESATLPPDVAPLAELLLAVKANMEGQNSCSSLEGRLEIPSLPLPLEQGWPIPPYRDVKDFSVSFSLLARSRLLDDRGGTVNSAYVFAEDNLASLSSIDLLLLRDALVTLNAFDTKWEGLLASLPKGIDAVTQPDSMP